MSLLELEIVLFWDSYSNCEFIFYFISIIPFLRFFMVFLKIHNIKKKIHDHWWIIQPLPHLDFMVALLPASSHLIHSRIINSQLKYFSGLFIYFVVFHFPWFNLFFTLLPFIYKMSSLLQNKCSCFCICLCLFHSLVKNVLFWCICRL